MGGMKREESLPPGAAPAMESPPPATAPLMVSSVVAGFPSPAEQYVERPLDLNDLLVARPAATYFVRAQGDSMVGAGVQDGDLLAVDRSLEPEDGSMVIACVDGEFTVKTYRHDRRGVRLEAANPAYPPIRFAGEMELRVFGVVTAVVHRLVPAVRPERGSQVAGHSRRSQVASRTCDVSPETRDQR